MDKVYITKAKLQEFMNQLAETNNDYPKPLLTLLAALFTFIFILIALVAMIIIIIGVAAYSLLFWIDILVGKYIIKRIFKL